MNYGETYMFKNLRVKKNINGGKKKKKISN